MNKPKKFVFPKKLNKVAAILIIIGIGIGLLVTAQFKTKTLRVSNSITPYVSLKETRDKLTTEQNNLKNQITELQKNIKDDQNDLKKQSQSKKKVEELENYKELIGLTEKEGEGVVINLDDSHINSVSTDSITHAADLRDIINFLWSLGATAVSINGERVVLNTSIDCIVNTVLINSTKTTAPFNISAIGDPKRMYDELNNENNLKDIHKRVKSEGLVFGVSQVKNIIIPSYDGSFPIKYSSIK